LTKELTVKYLQDCGLLPYKTQCHKFTKLDAEELQRVTSYLWEAYSQLLNTNISTYNNENIFKSEVEL